MWGMGRGVLTTTALPNLVRDSELPSLLKLQARAEGLQYYSQQNMTTPYHNGANFED
jgi:hypothetical protein